MVVALVLIRVSAIDAAGRSQASIRSADCGQLVTVVGVRGSGDAQSGDLATDKYGDQVHGMGKPGAAFAVALANKLSRGAVTFDPVVYPAVGLLGNWRKIINTVGAGAKIGVLGSYNGSVNDGKAALRQVISSEARVCPKVKLVLVGYSQGAQVVADVYQRDLSPSQRSRIASVVVFGDPYFNPADTKPDVGSYDPTRYGGLGKRGLYPSSSTPIFSICHLYDQICQGAGRDQFSQHTNYQNDPWIKIAAAKIASITRVPGPGSSELVTVSGQIGGKLQIDRSTKADVRTFAGPAGSIVHGTFQAPGDPTYTAFGYDCSSANAKGIDPGAYQPAHTRCGTIYYFSDRTNTLSAFWTSSSAFHTAAGTHPGMSQNDADHLEGRHATGSARPAITYSTATTDLDLDNAGGHPVSISPTQPYRWLGGTVRDFALESTLNPVGLLFV